MIHIDILPSVMQDVNMKKNLAAQALGKLGGRARAKLLTDAQLSEIGKKGGAARASKLSAAERSEIASKAVQARIAQQQAKVGKA
jgi:hypothetical protein